jgi:transposase
MVGTLVSMPDHVRWISWGIAEQTTRPRQATVVCSVHGELDADLNGARNIAARAGLGSGQASAA